MVGRCDFCCAHEVEIEQVYVPENPNTRLIQEIPKLFTDITFDPSCHTFALAYEGKNAEWKACAACRALITRQEYFALTDATVDGLFAEYPHVPDTPEKRNWLRSKIALIYGLVFDWQCWINEKSAFGPSLILLQFCAAVSAHPAGNHGTQAQRQLHQPGVAHSAKTQYRLRRRSAVVAAAISARRPNA